MSGRVSGADLKASLVVVLVGLPFYEGVSAASGTGMQAGLMTALVGGLVVGSLGGARLQVTGPAVGLAALVLPLVQAHGLAGMGAAVFLAGLLQMAAGLLGAGALGRWVPVPVVAGAVCAAGLAQALSQLTVITGHAPSAHAVTNLLGLPHALAGVSLCCAVPALLAGGVMLEWHRLPYRWARSIPAPLAAVVLASLAYAAFPSAAPYLHAAAVLPSLDVSAWLTAFRDPDVVASGGLIALVASAESLVSAEATAWAAARPVTLGRNRDLVAQGVGNILCGMLGGLPLAGAIPRSAANIRAGAQTAASSVLAGVWLLGLLALTPCLLHCIPAGSLAALLVLGGWRLVWERSALTASVWGMARVAPFLVTVCVALSWSLAAGLAAGCAVSLVFAGAAAASRPRLLARAGSALARARVETLVTGGQAAT